MVRIAFLVIALAAAAMAAMLTGSVAHDEFGVPLDVIRVDALKASMVLAAVLGDSPGYFLPRFVRVRVPPPRGSARR
jgi:hypothetical protein